MVVNDSPALPATRELTPQEHRLEMERMGRREYVLMKMIEYGFWPQGMPTPLERQRNEAPAEYQERTRLLGEFKQLAKEIADAGADIHKVHAQIVAVRSAYKATYVPLATIRRIVSQEIMLESKKRRAERKAKREQDKKERAASWQKQMAEEILFIGRGYSSLLADAKVDEARLKATGLPVIATGKELAASLGISFSQLRFLSYHRDAVAKDNYKRYTIPKRTGGNREIAAPMPLLKHVQRQVLDAILSKLAAPAFAHGFLPGKSVITNAGAHVPSHARPALVINMDLKDFFPTITFQRVRGLFKRLGYSGRIASILAMVCTDCHREPIEVGGRTLHVATECRTLPQGSPASPAITNILCKRMDNRLHGLAAKFGLAYTRYADDLTFSAAALAPTETAALGKFCFKVSKIVEAEGFRVNDTKTRFMRQCSRQEITGVVVNSGAAGIPKPWIKRFRAALHNASKLAEARGGVLPMEICNELRGMAAWAHAVDPARYKKLIDGAGTLLATQAMVGPRKKESRVKIPGGVLAGGRVVANPPPKPAAAPPMPGPTSPAQGPGGGIGAGTLSIKGKAIYVTGAVPGYTKDDLEKLVKEHGGVWKSFGKGLDLLVIGDKPGPAKLDKAAQLGLKTMSIADFFKKLGIWK